MREDEPKAIALRGWQIPASRMLHRVLAYPFNLRERLRMRSRGVAAAAVTRQLEPPERSAASQQGEDAILRDIFFRIGPGRRFFVEFGVEDGSVCNTSLLAARYGWGGLYIEADPQDAQKLRRRWAARSDIVVFAEFVTAENIAGLFADAGVPAEPDLLSIDIDGNDYWVWKALGEYRPRVVVIEYNAAYPPPRRWIMAYNPAHRWDRTSYFGASLSALTDLGAQLGYALIGTENHGLNAFFLRRDILPESGFAELSPEEAYHPPRYGLLGLPFPLGRGPSAGDT